MMQDTTPIEKPMLFSAPMVRAILEGRKTQTRRIVKPQEHGLNCPHPVGSRIWVRETWATSHRWDSVKPSELETGGSCPIYYRASDDIAVNTSKDGGLIQNWRPSIYMPRWASRITLEVTDVRVQLLQEISLGDAMEEGCPFPNMADGPDPRKWFAELWGSIYGPNAWERNPWVWAYTFKVLQ